MFDIPALVSYSASLIRVAPFVTDRRATVRVNGAVVSSGSYSGFISLSTGTNQITIVSTALDGVTESTYNIQVTRPPCKILKQ